MRISVIIPNYNGVHLFPDTLPALKRALAFHEEENEIIIVDDCSTDDSIEYLRENFPEITVIQNNRNSGFSVTVNKGIFAARFELVLLLNSDVKLGENYFEPQLKYFEQADTFGVMGRVVGWNDDFTQDGAKYPEIYGFKYKTSLNYQVDDNLPVYTSFLCGANALICRDKILHLDGLDEIYSPFYMEDVDLSIRAWEIGFKCYYEHRAVCHHKTSESIRTKEKKEYVRTIYNRNKLFFHAIHLNGLNFIGWAFQVFFELIFRVITLRLDYPKSVYELLKNWEMVHSSSKSVRNNPNNKRASLSLKQVRQHIKRSLKGRQVKFFRS